MPNTPLLSVVTPVFNGKLYIEGCLLSVINQNCPQAEHIVIDGGSTDGTVEIIERYARQHPHIRWVSEKDKGQSDAMNKGMRMARGKIVGLLNFDDYYEPSLLSKVIKAFEGLPEPAFVAGNCRVFKDDGSLFYINKPTLDIVRIYIRGDKNQFPHNPAAYFYHRSLHDKVGFYKEDDHYAMDLDFLLRAIPAAHLKYVDEIWGNYRYLEASKTVQAIRNNQLEANIERTMRTYRRKLPLQQQLYIKAFQCFRALWRRVSKIYVAIRYPAKPGRK